VHSIKIRLVGFCDRTVIVRAGIFLFVLIAIAFSGHSAFAQTGYTGILGAVRFTRTLRRTLLRSRTPGFRKPLCGASRSALRAT